MLLWVAIFYRLAYNLGILGSEDRDYTCCCNADEHCNY